MASDRRVGTKCLLYSRRYLLQVSLSILAKIMSLQPLLVGHPNQNPRVAAMGSYDDGLVVRTAPCLVRPAARPSCTPDWAAAWLRHAVCPACPRSLQAFEYSLCSASSEPTRQFPVARVISTFCRWPSAPSDTLRGTLSELHGAALCRSCVC
ncbi:hypothetical protein VTK56DRAFT_3303 [Thermocarpiscus australiensis]